MIGHRQVGHAEGLRYLVHRGYKEWRRSGRAKAPMFTLYDRTEALIVSAIVMARYPELPYAVKWSGFGDKRGIPPLIIT